MVFTGTSVEILALIFLVAAAIKILVILISPKSWSDLVVKKVWKNSNLMMIVSLILAAAVLYLLLGAGITITEIFAVMLFLSLLAAVGVAIYAREVVSVAQRLLKDRNIVKKSWLYLLIWIILILWGLKELFM